MTTNTRQHFNQQLRQLEEDGGGGPTATGLPGVQDVAAALHATAECHLGAFAPEGTDQLFRQGFVVHIGQNRTQLPGSGPRNVLSCTGRRVLFPP